MIHVLYENADWLPPLTRALEARGLPYALHFCDGGWFDVQASPPEGVWINRMSPSAHTRDHGDGVVYMREFLAVLEAAGRRVINGSAAYALEVSKVRQHAALEAFGILTPRTVAVAGTRGLKEAAQGMAAPFITKHNQGGKGLGVQLFRDVDAFDAYVDGPAFEPAFDGVTLLQQYVEPPSRSITRVEIVDGRFLYAIRASTAGGFELCPADACQVNDAFCPVGDTGKFGLAPITADDPLVQKYLAFCRAHRVDVTGIEFVEGADGRRYTYDINMNTNYNGDVERAHGLDGMAAIAALCERELARRTGASAA
ncbi:MAG: ATP-grasp domain-containing protein [Myxococcota bacterium]